MAVFIKVITIGPENKLLGDPYTYIRCCYLFQSSLLTLETTVNLKPTSDCHLLNYHQLAKKNQQQCSNFITA